MNYLKIMKNELALYIHIPFCEHKCIYCDFYSITKFENKSIYLSSLKNEIKSYSNKFSSKIVTSIFFGGGTPSILDTAELSKLLEVVYRNYKVSDNCEITIETNPGTVDKKKLQEFVKIGINRISIGVQSFNNNELKFLTRIHNREVAISTIINASEVGFKNINIDLIFSLPNQTKNTWISNLQRAVELPVSHISAYSLILEHGTILNKLVNEGKVKLHDEDFDASLYETTIDFLIKKGFTQYEVSNFCKEGYECKHNLSYWEHKTYLGFGTSAHSFDGKKRWWNYSGVKQYIAKIKNYGYAICGSEELTKTELQNEFVMLSLRSKGLDLKQLDKIHGNEWISENGKVIDELMENNYLIKNDNFIKFTSKGYKLCDEILTRFN